MYRPYEVPRATDPYEHLSEIRPSSQGQSRSSTVYPPPQSPSSHMSNVPFTTIPHNYDYNYVEHSHHQASTPSHQNNRWNPPELYSDAPLYTYPSTDLPNTNNSSIRRRNSSPTKRVQVGPPTSPRGTTRITTNNNTNDSGLYWSSDQYNTQNSNPNPINSHHHDSYQGVSPNTARPYPSSHAGGHNNNVPQYSYPVHPQPYHNNYHHQQQQDYQPHTNSSIFDKLTNPKLYTGIHKHRFDRKGNGIGKSGRDVIPKGKGHVGYGTVHVAPGRKIEWTNELRPVTRDEELRSKECGWH
eukprot:PhF_6_TR42896/c0_g1_i2/m.64994